VVFHYKSQVLLRYTYVNIIYYFKKKLVTLSYTAA
jgi:hypothetical protein